MNWQQKKRFFARVKNYYWDDPYLFKECNDNVIRRCVLESEMEGILTHCHALQAGGHHGAIQTAAKVLQSRFFWLILFVDAHEFGKRCDSCQRSGNISKRNEMPLNTIL